MFTVVPLLLYLAKSCRGLLKCLLVAIALMIPCIYAGLRDVNVGTDVQTYLIWDFDLAKSVSLNTFLKLREGIAPIGYSIFIWIITKVTGSLVAVLFILQFLTIFPIYKSLEFYSADSISVGIMVYLLLFYPISMNAMKQMVAVSWCLYSLIWMLKSERIASLFSFLLALSFHQTAFLAIPIYILGKIIYRSSDHRRYLRIYLLAMTGLLISMYIFRNHVTSLASLKDSYEYVVTQKSHGINRSMLLMMILAIAISLSVFNSKKFTADGRYADDNYFTNFVFVNLILGIGLLMFQFEIFGAGLSRMSYYYLIFLPIYTQLLFINRRFMNLGVILVIYLICYFIFNTVIIGGNQCYPFILNNNLFL